MQARSYSDSLWAGHNDTRVMQLKGFLPDIAGLTPAHQMLITATGFAERIQRIGTGRCWLEPIHSPACICTFECLAKQTLLYHAPSNAWQSSIHTSVPVTYISAVNLFFIELYCLLCEGHGVTCKSATSSPCLPAVTAPKGQ